MEAAEKLVALRSRLKAEGRLLIAFSGGVDSTFLAAVAREELGNGVLAVTAVSPTYTAREREEAVQLAARLGLRHEIVDSNELDIPGFADNPPDRCYYCKNELFRLLREIAARHGIVTVADGANADDTSDYRPGRKAAAEFGIVSPLLEAGLTKQEIRGLSRQMGLPTADKPPLACLASRFPYGSRITPDKLRAVEAVEEGLRRLGFDLVRVRHHGDIARIEVDAGLLPRLCEEPVRRTVLQLARDAGFLYVAADLQGYRTGSMNEPLWPPPQPSSGHA